jgi:hypothetical protein
LDRQSKGQGAKTMDDSKEQAKQAGLGVQNPGARRHQSANVNTVCPSCGVYPGQLHNLDCECLDETTERNEQWLN